MAKPSNIVNLGSSFSAQVNRINHTGDIQPKAFSKDRYLLKKLMMCFRKLIMGLKKSKNNQRAHST